jgi:predicted nucleic acid-binding protein
MLIIYLLEGNPSYSKRVQYLLQRSFERKDSLHTSFLAFGEVLAGAIDSPEKVAKIQSTMAEMGFTYLPFDAGAVMPFSFLRAKNKLKAADAIHLASAASSGIDLFLTGDKQLLGVTIPGIQFIADFNTPLL